MVTTPVKLSPPTFGISPTALSEGRTSDERDCETASNQYSAKCVPHVVRRHPIKASPRAKGEGEGQEGTGRLNAAFQGELLNELSQFREFHPYSVYKYDWLNDLTYSAALQEKDRASCIRSDPPLKLQEVRGNLQNHRENHAETGGPGAGRGDTWTLMLRGWFVGHGLDRNKRIFLFPSVTARDGDRSQLSLVPQQTSAEGALKPPLSSRVRTKCRLLEMDSYTPLMKRVRQRGTSPIHTPSAAGDHGANRPVGPVLLGFPVS